MADDRGSARPADERPPDPVCPWCSAPLPAADAAVCPACEARLVEPADVQIPGVTAVDPALLAAAARPRKTRRTIGAFLVGNDDGRPNPSPAEMPALERPAVARPSAAVRREIIRLEMDARLAALEAEVAARNADGAARLARGATLAPAPADEATPATGLAGEATPATGLAGEATPATGPETPAAEEPADRTR